MEPTSKLTLDALLAPLSVDEFIARHWRKKTLWLPGEPEKARALGVDTSVLSQLGFDRRCHADASVFNAQGDYVEIPIDPQKWEHHYQGRHTINYKRVNDLLPHLERLGAEVRSRLGHAKSIAFNCTISPPGRGYLVHFDAPDLILIQLEGSKRFKIKETPDVFGAAIEGANGSKASLAKYRDQYPWGKDIAAPTEEGFVDRVLNPGDVVYIPAGTWHATEAVTHSVVMVLCLWPLAYVDLFHAAAEQLLRTELRWRDAVPLRPDGSAPPAAFDEWMAALTGRDAAAFMATVGDRMRSIYDERTGASARAVAIPPAPSSTKRVVPADRLRLSAGTSYRLEHDERGDECVVLSCLPTSRDHVVEHEMVLDRDLLPFVDHLLRAGAFDASDAQSWTEKGAPPMGWEDVEEGLSRLLEVGFLERLSA